MSVTKVLEVLTNAMMPLMTDEEIGQEVGKLFTVSLTTINSMYEKGEQEEIKIVAKACRDAGSHFDPETMIADFKHNHLKIREV